MTPYIGRFAPSPTGPLHMGSMLTALISYLDARKSAGQWLLRIEDIDPPREVPSATTQILNTLRTHGLNWDGDVRFQSQYSALYEQRLQQLTELQVCYSCTCSRKQLIENNQQHLPNCGKHTGIIHTDSALRYQADQTDVIWDDLFLGIMELTADQDFVLKRRDGLYAYQLAVVADDIDQGITHVIRGKDLLPSTPMQLMLYKSLGAQPPHFAHAPLVLNAQGQKLSKQNFAPAVNDDTPVDNLLLLGAWLNLKAGKKTDSPQELLGKFVDQWDRVKVMEHTSYVL